MGAIGKLLKNPLSVVQALGRRGFFHSMPDEMYLKLCFKASVGYELDLENPQTFNEKLQWLKLHDRNPLYTTLVDKAEVKSWVAERIGWEHVIPTFGVWDSFDAIDFGALPERFVLKCTHDSGGLVICRDRSTFDVGAARRKIERSLSRNYYWSGREWPYKNVKPRVIAEEYLEPDVSGDLPDYKLFCSDGEVKGLYVASGRQSGEEVRFDFYDSSFNHLPIVSNCHPASGVAIEPPAAWDEMKGIAEKLSESFGSIRVDLYDTGRGVMFGELTFYHMSGLAPFVPSEWDERLGSWIRLPSGGGLLVSDGVMLLVSGPTPERAVRELIDYKFMCFDGEPRCAFTCTGRSEGDLRVDFFDNDWNHMPFARHYRNSAVPPAEPRSLREMQMLARKLSEGIPFVRVDFYEQGDRVLFGEMTFYPGSGFEEFDPSEWDGRLGAFMKSVP